MTPGDGDRPALNEHVRTKLEVGLVIVLFLVGTIALITIFGPQTSRVLSVVSGAV